MRILATIFAGLLGLAFGSFLNVCLSRWPAGESIVKPASHCHACSRTLSWWENIPLLSWIALRGRCRTCHTSISWRYPLVELAVGLLWAYIVWRTMPQILFPHPFLYHLYAPILDAVKEMALVWFLTALAFLDAENLWLPNSLTLTGGLIGFVIGLCQIFLLVLMPLPIPVGIIGLHKEFLWALASDILQILAAAGLILLIRWIYWLVRRREGIGLGDAKLMAMLGAWLGLPGALLSFVIGVLLGALIALIALALPRREGQTWAATKLPLGTFLCIGGIIAALWGQSILDAYYRWSGL